MKKNQAKLLCAVVLTATSLQSMQAGHHGERYHDEIRPENVVMGIVGGAIAGLGIYALGSYFDWWGAPSCQDLLSQGERYVREGSQYREIYREALSIQGGYAVHHEEVLYQCAILKRGKNSVGTYISTLSTLIENIRSLREKIARRISDIEHDHASPDYNTYLPRLRTVMSELRTKEDELRITRGCLEKHRSYFKLFEEEDALAQEYGRELGIMQQYANNNEYEMARTLRAALSSRFNDAYGLIRAVRTLQSDIESFAHVLSGLAYNYPARSEYARLLLTSLRRIKEIVISEGEYARLLAQYEAAEREKEYLRLERERIANEQRIAAAKEREARAKEEQNRIKQQENRIREQELYNNRPARPRY